MDSGILILGAASTLSSIAALTVAVSSWRRWKKVERGIGKRIKELKSREEATLEAIIEALTAKDMLSSKAVLAVVEAARLLAEDARRLYEKTGDEEFLAIAERWEAFVQVNRKAVEKVLGYAKEPDLKSSSAQPQQVTA